MTSAELGLPASRAHCRRHHDEASGGEGGGGGVLITQDTYTHTDTQLALVKSVVFLFYKFSFSVLLIGVEK